VLKLILILQQLQGAFDLAKYPIAKNLGDTANPYWKLVGTNDFATNQTSVGAIASNTSCCPTRVIPCCEDNLASDFTTTSVGTGIGAGGGRAKGQTSILVSGLKCGDVYMGRLGNGLHTMCLVGQSKYDLKRDFTFHHPTNDGGITYTTGGNPSGRVDFSSWVVTKYYYNKTYKGRTQNGANFYARYRNMKMNMAYDKDLRVAGVYSGYTYGAGNRDNHKQVKYTFEESYKNWRFRNNKVFGSQGDHEQFDMTELNMNSLQWTFEINRKRDMYYICGPFGYSCYVTPKCQTIDTQYNRKNTKHWDTTKQAMARGKSNSQTVTPVAFDQDFSYDMLHPNGYIFHVSFTTSGYNVSKTSDVVDHLGGAVYRIGKWIDLRYTAGLDYISVRPHHVLNKDDTRVISTSDIGTTGYAHPTTRMTSSCSAVTGISFAYNPTHTPYPTYYIYNRTPTKTYYRGTFATQFTKTGFDYIPYEKRTMRTFGAPASFWWLGGNRLDGGNPNNW